MHTNHISYANDYATHWSVATMRQEIMHAYGECILKGMNKSPTKLSSKKREIWAPDSEIVVLSTDASGAEEALKDVGVDPRRRGLVPRPSLSVFLVKRR
ncbi:hypothetical protein CYMTET_56553 [Cymbomonas tetramitiformis]|uniref:Uncharacterized protein n=1 Tax=Cymbomonas tetramitiformis TaxID=36881 RepID=A0AAE0BB26_9CHLO|nr:hypothetical protein CYMTET_56553 [Cymbomonas tetramitiformis]